jgi:hypothetical protein
MNRSTSSLAQPPAIQIRVHLVDGAIESFVQVDPAKAEAIWRNVDLARLFTQQRIVIAGTYSKSVFICSEVVRIDFVQQSFDCWQFSEGYSDIVELSEDEFRKNVHLDQPELMPKRETPTPVGDPLVSFLKLHFKKSPPIYVMVEFPVKLPAENQSFMRFLLSRAAFQMRLQEGGVAVANLANLTGYTVYPGVAQIPSDAWLAEPILSNSIGQIQKWIKP